MFADAQVVTLVMEVQGIHDRLEKLEKFNYRMSQEDIGLCWKTMDFPAVSYRGKSHMAPRSSASIDPRARVC